MKSLRLLIGLVLLCVGHVYGQQSVQLRNLKVEAPSTEFFSELKGLKLKMDLYFTQYPENYFARNYTLDFVLIDAQGKVVYDSQNSVMRDVAVSGGRSSVSGYQMEDLGVEAFAPFKEIQLESGSQKVTAVFSLRGDQGGFTNFAKQEISFKHTKVETKTFEQQVFTVSEPTLMYGVAGFGESVPGMNVAFEVGMKYGANQVDAESYDVHLSVLSVDGSKVLYDTRKSGSVHHHSQGIRTEDFPGKADKLDFFVSYVALKLDAPGEALLVLEIEQVGLGKREVYRKVHRLNTPPKYRYEQQVFTPGEVRAGRELRDGVAGLGIGFPCGYKYNGPLIDAERGDFYFFAMVFGEKGDTVFSPVVLKRTDYGTTQGWDGHNPLLEASGGKVDLFIPFHRMRLKPGTHKLSYVVFVTDRTRKARFPMVVKGSVQVEQPKVLSYRMTVKRLEVIPGNYDTQVAVFGSVDPDLEWRLEVGEDTEFQSVTAENSLVAHTGSHVVRFCEGDEVYLGLWDIDSGIFNRNDVMGRWKIPYAGKGDSFVYAIDSQGLIKTMEVELVGE